MKSPRPFCLLAFFFVIASSLQSQDVIFNKVLPPYGRTFTHVTGIVQDNIGFMWFATKKGLYKYDGYSMISYKNDPLNPNSLASNFLESICMGSGDSIWVGTFGSGLDLFDPSSGNFTHFRHDPNNNASISNDTIWAILQDSKGVVWIGSPGGLDRFDPKTRRFTNYRHHADDTTTISSDIVRTIYEDRKGTLWIG